MSAIPLKPFVYLIQSADCMPYPQLASDSCDIILLTWRKPSADPGALFYPDSSWNEGRNRLLQAARQKASRSNNDYLYYIFMDDDCRVEVDTDLAKRLGIFASDNPFRTFEQCLLSWMPAVGYTRYAWQHVTPGAEVDLGYNFDANFNAFHRETLSLLLPYYTGFDAESWFYSQLLICHLTALFFNPYRLQFNILKTTNLNRQGYRALKKYWHIPTTFLMNAFSSDRVRRIKVQKPNSTEPIPATPLRKNCDYSFPQDRLERHFDLAHPFFKHRYATAASDRRNLPGIDLKASRVAVCLSGSCQGLSQTWDTLKQMLLDQVGKWDLFLYAPDDEYAHLAHTLHPTVLRVEADQPIAEGPVINGRHCLLKSGLQAYLQQLNGLQQCHRLLTQYSRDNGIHYDWVIRCRPDLLFVTPVAASARFDPHYIYVADFHQFDGCNDRFAIGSTDNMAIYMNQLNDFKRYVMDWHAVNPNAAPVSAEMFTAGYLRQHGVGVRSYPFRFHRVRPNRVSLDAPPPTVLAEADSGPPNEADDETGHCINHY